MKNLIHSKVDFSDFSDEIRRTVQGTVQSETKLTDVNERRSQKPNYLSRQEVCTKFGISYPTLRRHINNGVIPSMTESAL